MKSVGDVMVLCSILTVHVTVEGPWTHVYNIAVLQTAPQFCVLIFSFLLFGFPLFSRLLIGCCYVVGSETSITLLQVVGQLSILFGLTQIVCIENSSVLMKAFQECFPDTKSKLGAGLDGVLIGIQLVASLPLSVRADQFGPLFSLDLAFPDA